jgi:5-carboxymethyl-2-hydroxymuconate isomerase
MPHVTIEFSKGLEQSNDIQAVCDKLFAVLSAQDAFEAPSAIKIRATPVAYFRIGSEPQTFVHATLLLMKGRDELTRNHLNRTILETLDKALPGVGSITVQDVEMTRATYAGRVLQALAD